MTYVRSRKFCCCLPVRFGVFCMALIGLVGGGAIGVVGWIQVHRYCKSPSKDPAWLNAYFRVVVAGLLDLSSHEKLGLWFVSLSYTWFALIAIVGYVSPSAPQAPHH